MTRGWPGESPVEYAKRGGDVTDHPALDLDEIERLAKSNAGEPYRGALVDEVRRLRARAVVVCGPSECEA